MQPTRRPMTTDVDFMMGEPKRSQRMMVRKTRKPRPMYSAEPQTSACGAAMLGHLAKKAGSPPRQRPAPPAQFSKPDWMRLTPGSC